jgi:hypothetical protein
MPVPHLMILNRPAGRDGPTRRATCHEFRNRCYV